MKKLLLLFCLISLFVCGCSVKDTAGKPDETVRLSAQEVPVIEYDISATDTASEVTEPLLKLKGCTLRECSAAYDPDADTFRKTYTALPSGDWLRQKSEDPVTDAYGNIVPLYNHYQIIDTNGQDKYPLETESTYHLMVLGFDDNRILRRDCTISEDGDTSLRYPVIPNEITYDDFLVMQDTETGKYYYAKPDGTPLCNPIFDECTRIAGGSAVVWIDNDVYLLKRKG